MADDTREKIVTEWTPMNETGRRAFLAELDRADALRDLLADEDRAVELVARAISGCSHQEWEDVKRRKPDWRDTPGADAARAVLAALREVAGL